MSNSANNLKDRLERVLIEKYNISLIEKRATKEALQQVRLGREIMNNLRTKLTISRHIIGASVGYRLA